MDGNKSKWTRWNRPIAPEGQHFCSLCEQHLPIELFGRHKRRGGLVGQCNACFNARNNKYYQERSAWREKRKAANKRYNASIRNRVLEAYGARCACCGETNKGFLSLDHVGVNGAAHRKLRGSTGVMQDVIKEGFPPAYQVLCYNCNVGRQMNTSCKGVCPHKACEE